MIATTFNYAKLFFGCTMKRSDVDDTAGKRGPYAELILDTQQSSYYEIDTWIA